MKYVCFSLVACALLSSGCSMLVACSGEDLSRLANKAQVHDQFGKPASTGSTDGQSFEDFLTRRKISDQTMSAHCLGMSIAMTYGLGEFILFPYELYLLGQRTALGQTIRFTYDPNGSVTGVFLDGERLEFSSKAPGPDK